MTKLLKINDTPLNENAIKALASAFKTIEYGHVVVTVHNSKIVQIDKTEKIRFGDLPLHESGSGI